MRTQPFRKSTREPTITLINVVFLILIFFLVAGTIAPTRDPRVTLISAADLAAAQPPDGILVLPDGTLLSGGLPVTVTEAAASGGAVRLIPDRALPAARLVALGRDLRAAGATGVVLVGERSLP
jgi:biopolymer transport protein ExbD